MVRVPDQGNDLEAEAQRWRDVTGPGLRAAREARRIALVGREDLVAQVEALLFRHDPIGIGRDEDNPDEYRGEAETLVLRLPRAGSAAELVEVVHGVFVQWFDAGIAGPPAHYTGVADELWALLGRGG